MPNKRPPNAEATEFRAGAKQVEIARQGGYASGVARREKKTVQKILNDFLERPASKNPQVASLAAKMGLNGEESIKELFTMICALNTLKRGDLSDLETLTKLLGEQTEMDEAEAKKQADFLDAVKKAVNNGN